MTTEPTRYARKKKAGKAATEELVSDQDVFHEAPSTTAPEPLPEAPAPPVSVDKSSFKKDYATLERIVGKLQSGSVDDIDTLIPLVEEATRAYNGCKARIDAVEQMITKTVG